MRNLKPKPKFMSQSNIQLPKEPNSKWAPDMTISEQLVDYLNRYAETGKEYTVILKKIIEQNKLIDFDDVKILPDSEAAKNLI